MFFLRTSSRSQRQVLITILWVIGMFLEAIFEIVGLINQIIIIINIIIIMNL